MPNGGYGDQKVELSQGSRTSKTVEIAHNIRTSHDGAVSSYGAGETEQNRPWLRKRKRTPASEHEHITTTAPSDVGETAELNSVQSLQEHVGLCLRPPRRFRAFVLPLSGIILESRTWRLADRNCSACPASCLYYRLDLPNRTTVQSQIISSLPFRDPWYSRKGPGAN